MAFANASYTDIIATTLEHRSKTIADNMSSNTALLNRLKAKGKIQTVSGGSKIVQTVSFAENGNFMWYSGYETLQVSPSDVISAAEFAWKQCAVAVVASGLETDIQNTGKEALIDLLEARIDVAEKTMLNNLSVGLYSDGTGSGGKQVTGLGAAIPITVTNTYGGIDRNVYTFWRPIYQAAGYTSATLVAGMDLLWAQLVSGTIKPDLYPCDANMWALYEAALQPLQRITDPKMADAGFQSYKYKGGDVVLDGGIGGSCTTKTMFFLNTDYIHWRPAARRNMVPLSPNRRFATNQDAEVQLLAWAGNLTMSGSRYHGRLVDSD
jgi:hypothetical protein